MSRARTARTALTARTTRTALVLLAGPVVLAGLALTGCDQAKERAGEIVSSATGAVASAAEEKMNEVKDGVNAAGDVKAGPTSTDGDRTVAEVTATNPRDKSADYTVRVDFRDDQGNLLDTVVVNVGGVAPGASKTATARSNRTLSGATKAEIAQALRH
ncbi:FxLYD domain-containing protein [Streptomyces sp. NPDC126499]|uniref:FxLYD domain-containing protein n=1 Tax=Streptomyces sp. NPDC126499 TaxID=3155314 RepID=UPI00331DBFDB